MTAKWANYQTLGKYNANVLGIPSVSHNFQVVPQWAGLDYSAPDYDRLTNGSCNNYTSVSQAYPDPAQVQVKFVQRPCQ